MKLTKLNKRGDWCLETSAGTELLYLPLVPTRIPDGHGGWSYVSKRDQRIMHEALRGLDELLAARLARRASRRASMSLVNMSLANQLRLIQLSPA